MGVGGTTSGDFLVHALGVGNESGSSDLDVNFLAHALSGRNGRAGAVGSVGITVGHRSVDQYFPAGVFADLWTVRLVSQCKVGQAVSFWSGAGGCDVCSVHCALAGSE